jgi:hypothetical protein
MQLLKFTASCVLLLGAAAGDKYTVTLTEHSPKPVVSGSNAAGQGKAPDGCISFNPSYIPASSTFSTPGVLVRLCCGASCIGHGAEGGNNLAAIASDPSADAAERIGFAPCDLETGKCKDVDPNFNLDPTSDTEDPRAFYYDSGAGAGGAYYNFYFSGTGRGTGNCTSDQCNVKLAKTTTPLVASSWQAIGTYPWHRNGCCAMKPKGQRSYCIWGESGPFPGESTVPSPVSLQSLPR